MRHSVREIALVGQLVVGIVQRSLSMAKSVSILSFEAQSIGEVVHAVAVLLAVDELALVSASWLLESAFSVELSIIERSKIFVFLFVLLPAQLAVGLVAVVVLPVELMSVAYFLALAVDLVLLELSLI